MIMQWLSIWFPYGPKLFDKVNKGSVGKGYHATTQYIFNSRSSILQQGVPDTHPAGGKIGGVSAIYASYYWFAGYMQSEQVVKSVDKHIEQYF